MSAQPNAPKPPSGMWAEYEPPEIGEPLEELAKFGDFLLLAVKVREGIGTAYGARDAVDLAVQTTEQGRTRMFSGFSAGVVGQAKRIEDGDLPAVCRIVETTASRGKTRGLELVRMVDAGADLAAIARALPTQVLPIAPAGAGDDIPY